MEYKHRHTKIIFTIGPATEDEETLTSLIKANVDVCRINMAHASHEWTRKIIRRIRSISAELDNDISIMMDIKGPEIRTGELPNPIELEVGQILELSSDESAKPEIKNNFASVSVNYQGLKNDLNVGDLVLVDNGLIHLEVIEKKENSLRTKVRIPGLLKSKRHINLPGIKVNLPALTEKDKANIELGATEGVDFFALSFVREADDIRELRSFLDKYESKARIIAKIEDQSGIQNITSIIKTSDGIMIARGDLGIECPMEEIPILQKQLIQNCINLGKPVIVATHMLESMINAPVPTRAEVSDVSNAVYEETDCIMLSAETTVGGYPLKCIDTMKKIIYKTESVMPHSFNTHFQLFSPKNKMLRSAVVLAQELNNTGIIVFTRSGHSAQLISSLRPTRCPLYIFTDNAQVRKQLRLLWGITPLYLEFSEDRNLTIAHALDLLKQRNSIQKDDYVIILTSIPVNAKAYETIQLRKVG